jgi:hypothetical protein
LNPLPPGSTLFYVQDMHGGSVPMKYKDNMIYTSKTLDINVTRGGAIVNIEYRGGGNTGATGPSVLDNAQEYTPGKTDYELGSVVLYKGQPYVYEIAVIMRDKLFSRRFPTISKKTSSY